MKEVKTRNCPKCGQAYHGYPALSRQDNLTEICPSCGIREALGVAGISPRAKKEILVQMIKEQYKPGMRVRLLKMDDLQAPPIGTEGTVRGVDDIGSVMVAWDNGCGLNVILDEDRVEILPAERNH